MILTLDEREAEMLKRLLENSLVELRDEIHHTDRTAYKAELKTEETLLRGVLQKIEVSVREETRASGTDAKKISQPA